MEDYEIINFRDNLEIIRTYLKMGVTEFGEYIGLTQTAYSQIKNRLFPDKKPGKETFLKLPRP